MIWHIARKDLLSNIQTLRFGVGLALCAVLIPLMVYAGVKAYREKLTNANVLSQKYADDLKDIRVYSYAKPRIVRPPGVLEAIAVGVGDDVGNRVDIVFGQVPFVAERTGQTRDNPLLGGFLQIDAAFVITVVVSLLGVLFGYDAISGEKESGCLRQMLCAAVSRPQVVIGKVVGGLLTLAPVLGISFLISAAILEASDAVALTWGDRVRIAGTFLMGLVYGSLFLLLGVWISTRTRRSATSLMLALFVWTAWVVVASNISLSVAERLSPLPSRTALERARSELRKEERDGIDKIRKSLPKIRWNTVSSSGGRDGAIVITATTKEKYERERLFLSKREPVRIEYAHRRWMLEREYLRGLERQAGLAVWLSRVSPAFLFRNLSQILCRTDAGTHLRFMDRCRRYREEWIEYFQDRNLFASFRYFTPEPPEAHLSEDAHIVFRTGGTFQTLAELQEGRSWFEMLKEFTVEVKSPGDYPPLDLGDLPAFKMRPEEVAESLGRGAVDLGLLLGLWLVLFVSAYVSFLRYDVR